MKSQMLKTMVVGFLALAMLIPVQMVRSLFDERMERRDELVEKGGQALGGGLVGGGEIVLDDLQVVHRHRAGGQVGVGLRRHLQGGRNVPGASGLPDLRREADAVLFLPNGRADNARFRLGTDRYWIDVTVRGLTGRVRMGPVQQTEEAGEAPLPDVSTEDLP